MKKLIAILLFAFASGCILACGAGLFLFTVNRAGAPLRVHPTNPRYFTDNSGRAIYLSGATFGWESPLVDMTNFLNFMDQYDQNIIRLWATEATACEQFYQPGGSLSPVQYRGVGPGNANDGLPKFDINQLDQAYFDGIRANVIRARSYGVYVMVQLFQGFAVDSRLGQSPCGWPYHPFNSANNINGVSGDLNGDGEGTEVQTLESPYINRLQKLSVNKMIDTLNDLDNIIWEIANEANGTQGNTDWQYDMINHIRSYEAAKPKQHPIAMTSQAYGWDPTPPLFASPGDAISPGDRDLYRDNPPVSTGSKVILADADHLSAGSLCPIYCHDPQFIWKHFLRGNNTILLDIDAYPGPATDPKWLEARRAIKGTRSFSTRMKLASMIPSTSACSTTYCLVNPSNEYLVYQPNSGSFAVDIQSGSYSYEWFNPSTGSVAGTGSITASSGNCSFSPPFNGPAVLYLKRMNSFWRLSVIALGARITCGKGTNRAA
jgi:Putative collagen-binding domain of a collagenase